MLQNLLPPRLRASLRQRWLDAPLMLTDLPADLLDYLSPRSSRVPPARLRRRVAQTSSRKDFLATGRRCAEDLVGVLTASGSADTLSGAWLDFGCGCGRISRHLLNARIALTGVDVDRSQVRWAARHLPGRWLGILPEPPLPFPPGSFDVVFSVSVFTHLDESQQLAWLGELRRVLRPSGRLVASTHGPALAAALPQPYSLSADQAAAAGFVHVPSDRGFNHRASFHSRDYLTATWSAHFRPLSFVPFGLCGYQDLSVWECSEAFSAL